MRFFTLVLLASLPLALASVAAADTPLPPQAAPAVDNSVANTAKSTTQPDIDTSIPDAPGFAVIGLTPTTVLDPSATRVTFGQVLSYLDQNGNLKPGFALGGRPYFWFFHPDRDDYHDMVLGSKDGTKRGNYLLGVLARTDVSVGYANGGASQADRVGLGFSTELLLSARGRNGEVIPADTRLDDVLEQCVGATLKPTLEQDVRAKIQASETQANTEYTQWQREASHDPSTLPSLGGETIPGEVESDAWRLNWIAARKNLLVTNALATLTSSPGDVTNAVNTCYTQEKNRYAGRQSWILAGGLAVDGGAGFFRSARMGGGSIWTAYRSPMPGVDAQGLPNYLTLFGRYDFDQIAGTAPTQQRFDKGSLALVFGYDRPDKGFKISLQGGYQVISYHTAGPLKNSSSAFYQLVVDYQIATGVFVELEGGSGAPSPQQSGLKAGQFTLNLRFAPGSK